MRNYKIKGDIVMPHSLKEKLETVLELVNNVMINPDIDIEYCVPETEISENSNVTGDPYIQVKYQANVTHTVEQKIPLKRQYLKQEPQDIANLVTFYIEQFIEQIDSVEYGAQ